MKRRRVGKYGVAPESERTWNGVRFDSKAEMRHAQTLELRRKAGEVQRYAAQERFVLRGADGKTAVATYVADFLVRSCDKVWIEEVKGVETPEWKLKAKLFRIEYPHIELRVFDANGRRIQ